MRLYKLANESFESGNQIEPENLKRCYIEYTSEKSKGKNLGAELFEI